MQGHKKEYKKEQSDRKKKFYDDSDHQEYHITYDTFDEFVDEGDEGGYEGAAEKVSPRYYCYENVGRS